MSKKFAAVHLKSAPRTKGAPARPAGGEDKKGVEKSIKANKETFPFVTENL